MAPVLGYWKIRGLGQSIRLLLEFTGTKYEERLYTTGSDGDRSDWLNEKETLGLDFPNLPYYIDEDVKLTQSVAILKHVGLKHGLCGSSDAERITLEMLVQEAADIRIHYSLFAYLHYDTGMDDYLKRLSETGKKLSKYLGNKKWFMGDSITIVDFLMYELLDVNLKVSSSWLQDFSNLQAYHKRFENLPAIKNYMASPRFIRVPLNGISAKFNVKE
ncbi:glutathione S-transferase Mu 1-like isoform X2 [Penaeus japonicus]|uniref:glutathione S-transferase Mu 1-like isoform X1 n=1 Tax=Penaeus japonicus TaxID=27405 RepID=UPI001C713DCF|nr:glutathione S-transferase Mu 1-like isoform X1 [Penaeus japonicus]XP_042879695.1 glutathione S-transferase Mu 1-like isoform X2 [Penaeus japonicus]